MELGNEPLINSYENNVKNVDETYYRWKNLFRAIEYSVSN